MWNQTILYLSRNKYSIFILLILAGSLILKLHFAMVYATYTDEILSAIVAESISRTGLPTLPSSTIYPRALLHHYLLSVPIGLYGINFFSMRINSIILSLLTLYTVYSLGVRISTRPVAISAALVLSISSLFNQFALSGRMYMAYGAFHTLSLYFFYEGFIMEKARFKWLAFIFMYATMLSSEAGILLGPIFVFMLLVYHRTEWLRDRVIYPCFAIWFILTWLLIVYDIPGSYQPFTAHSGVPDPSIINTQMPLREIIGNLIYPWRALERSLPFSMSFFFIMTIWVMKRREFQRHYPMVALLPALIMESFLTYRIQYRIIVALLPLYILACCQFAETFLRWMKKKFYPSEGGLIYQSIYKDSLISSLSRIKQAVIIMVSLILLAMGFMYTNKINSIGALQTYIFQGFGYHDSRANQDLKPAYKYLSSHVESKDPIIVTTVEYGLFFLGASYDYYFLRQRIAGDKDSTVFIPFNKENEPYYGRPLIDSIEKLQHLIQTSTKPIWVVADFKANSYVGPDIMTFISKQFELVFDDYKENQTRIYRRIPKNNI